MLRVTIELVPDGDERLTRTARHSELADSASVSELGTSTATGEPLQEPNGAKPLSSGR